MTDGVISQRTTDNDFTLVPPYNIDDTMAQQLFDGSISQLAGQELYTALEVIGSVNLGSTELIIAQDEAAITSWWGTGINTGTNILLRTLIIRAAGPSFMSLTAYQVPVWAVIYGVVLLGEPAPPQMLLALVLILGGIAMAQWRSLLRAFGSR